LHLSALRLRSAIRGLLTLVVTPVPGGLERASSVRYLSDGLNLPNCLSFHLGALETTPSANHPRLTFTLSCPDCISILRFSGCAQFLAPLSLLLYV
jgi:hypothetical protein